jgi:D-tyrosyl-tRNA(Tyr) deacylase
VSRSQVTVANRITGRIDGGLLILVGFTEGDNESGLDWMAQKILGLRIFNDEAGRMNLSVRDIDGGILVVSQFTLYGDTQKGRRPSFIHAAPPSVAEPLYDRFVQLLRDRAPDRVETGVFGAMMDVELVNDGPVTLVLDR